MTEKERILLSTYFGEEIDHKNIMYHAYEKELKEVYFRNESISEFKNWVALNIRMDKRYSWQEFCWIWNELRKNDLIKVLENEDGKGKMQISCIESGFFNLKDPVWEHWNDPAEEWPIFQTNQRCPKCGSPLYTSDNPEYPFLCTECDENFFWIELDSLDAVELKIYIPVTESRYKYGYRDFKKHLIVTGVSSELFENGTFKIFALRNVSAEEIHYLTYYINHIFGEYDSERFLEADVHFRMKIREGECADDAINRFTYEVLGPAYKLHKQECEWKIQKESFVERRRPDGCQN